ncbi:DNA-binding response regulator [Bombiscardovia nodaiensis]|uniref:DNA-binding response regulator n=1 Tax=Bombiscardovia nodaiensis TaxID=2932181 RepID=A0ABM8B5Z7_9BIFI|nr:DNA-binding response regulator [Bombiscardovia nodaiensis]
MIPVMLVDDDRLTRMGLSLMISKDKALQVVAEADDGAQAIGLLRERQTQGHGLPQVILMDVRMPRMDGVDATRIISQEFPACKTLILTTYDQDDYAFSAIEAGASGFLLKDTKTAQLQAAVHAVAEGDAVLTPRITRQLLDRSRARQTVPPAADPNAAFRASFASLSERERELAALIAQGLNNAEIADRLVIEPTSARRAVSRLLAKLHLRDRVQVAVSWYKSGLGNKRGADNNF